MNVQLVAEVLTGAWAIVFLVSFVSFAGALIYYNERRWPRFSSTMADSVWITAIVTLFYGYLFFDGNTDYRWVVYALTCPFLVRSLHTYYTCPSKQCQHGGAEAGQYALWASMAATAVTMLFGFAITQIPSPLAQWVLYGSGFVPFVFAIALLYKAIEYRPAQVPGGAGNWGIVLIGAGWLVFPVILALSPVMAGTLSFYGSVIAYAIGDLVAKVFASWFVGYVIRKQCGRCVPRAPRCKVHREVACLKPQCYRPMYADTHQTPALCVVHGVPNCSVCPSDPAAYAAEAHASYYDDDSAHPFYMARHQSQQTMSTTVVHQAQPSQDYESDNQYDGVQWIQTRKREMQANRQQQQEQQRSVQYP